MKIIKCDICKKELNPTECITGYSYDRSLDLCSECSSRFNEFKKDLNEQEKKLTEEYEEKRKKIYESTITKYGLNKE